MDNGLPKSSRLYLRNDTKGVFEGGKSFSVKSLKCFYRVVESNNNEPNEVVSQSIKLMVSSPKRYLKRAVARNHMKRRLREAFRLYRSELSSSLDKVLEGKELHIALMYNRGEVSDYAKIEELVLKVIDELKRRLA